MAKIDRMTGRDYQEKHAKNLKGATDEIRRGVDALTKSPGVSASEEKDVWVARMTDTEVQERWARNVAKVPLEEWKADMKEKGIGRISAGLDRAKTKIADFGDKLLAFQKGALPEINARKVLTLDDAIAKADAWIRKMAEFKYKK